MGLVSGAGEPATVHPAKCGGVRRWTHGCLVEHRPAFVIVLDSVVAGGINLRIDERHETGGLGYSLARVHWGKGLTTEAATAVVE